MTPDGRRPYRDSTGQPRPRTPGPPAAGTRHPAPSRGDARRGASGHGGSPVKGPKTTIPGTAPETRHHQRRLTPLAPFATHGADGRADAAL